MEEVQTNYCCPECGASDTYRIQLYVAGHLRNKNGYMIGSIGGDALMAGMSKSSSQTALAQSLYPGAAPTEPTNYARPLAFSAVMLALVAAILYTRQESIPVAFMFAVVAAALFIFALAASRSFPARHEYWEEQRAVWSSRNDMFQRGWICVRCGDKWLPGEPVKGFLKRY